MTKLALIDLHKGVYEDMQGNITYACAYVYYGNKKNPVDQHNVPIGTFYQNPMELKMYLEQLVIPIVSEGLKNSDYKVTEVDFLANAPHPHLVLRCRDQGPINDHDINKMRELINRITKQTTLANNTPHLFQRSPYNLRKRKDDQEQVNEEQRTNLSFR